METRSGIILINKPKNMTSFDVCHKLQRIFFTRTIGHTGTLDPNATGLLVCLVNKATKVNPYLKADDKIYEAELQLGLKTDTGDIWGKTVEEKEIPDLTEEMILDVFNSFLGDQLQIPPMVSAIKVNGKKLYEYARENKKVELEPRPVHIYSLTLNGFEKDRIRFTAEVSSGTYIRTLCEDIAFKLNTVGTMSALNRTKTGKFSLNQAYNLEEITFETPLIPVKEILSHIPYIEYPVIADIINGRNIQLDSQYDRVLIGVNGEALAIYIREENGYHCERGLW